jgi:hypothetical protein
MNIVVVAEIFRLWMSENGDVVRMVSSHKTPPWMVALFFFYNKKVEQRPYSSIQSVTARSARDYFPLFLSSFFFFFSCGLRWWDGPDFQLDARHSRLDTFCPVTGMASFPVESAKFESGRHCFRRQYNKCGKWWNAHTKLKDQTTNDDKESSFLFFFLLMENGKKGNSHNSRNEHLIFKLNILHLKKYISKISKLLETNFTVEERSCCWDLSRNIIHHPVGVEKCV